MARSHIRSYVRTRRLAAGLSQKEFAQLVGINRNSASDYELERRTVPARLIIAGEIIFGERAHELFPAFYRAVQEEIAANAARMDARLRHSKSAAAEKKRRLLARIAKHSIPFDL